MGIKAVHFTISSSRCRDKAQLIKRFGPPHHGRWINAREGPHRLFLEYFIKAVLQKPGVGVELLKLHQHKRITLLNNIKRWFFFKILFWFFLWFLRNPSLNSTKTLTKNQEKSKWACETETWVLWFLLLQSFKMNDFDLSSLDVEKDFCFKSAFGWSQKNTETKPFKFDQFI